jgi:riboflavin kinase/FMN adenylyltransferase
MDLNGLEPRRFACIQAAMDRFASIQDAVGRADGAVLAIGNFDGVHRGHQALLERAVQRAHEVGGRPGVLTFHPHPARVLAPDHAPPMILSRDEKLTVLDHYGAQLVIEQPFDRAFASTPPAEFARRLADDLKLAGVVVGHDFCFGYKGAGGPRDLRAALGEDAVDVIEAVREGDVIASSSAIRAAIREGDVVHASELLNRPYDIAGVVEHGDGRGRTLGFPTVNLRIERELLPANGVYAARAFISGRAAPERAVINIGTRPTFDGGEARVHIEAHLLDFAGDLYDARVRLELVARLRDERRFDGVDELKAQIQRDVASAREALRHAP